MLWCLGGVAVFHLASASSWLATMMIVFFFCLIQASQHGCGRKNFYRGIFMGMLIYGWQLRFFLNIFGGAAVVLWLVLAFWLGLFMGLASHYQRKRSMPLQILLLVCSWMALEYVRGELYYLKFSWATPGMAFSSSPVMRWIGCLGVYGLSAGCLLIASLSLLFKPAKGLGWITGSTLVASVLLLFASNQQTHTTPASNSVQIGGLHLDDPGSPASVQVLNEFMDRHPTTELIVLAEYSFFGEPPKPLRDWCRTRHQVYPAGGTQPLANDTYYNTAFVISPDGEIIHKQVKSVPIQFFNDGLPAEKQDIWQSPWGPIGICICYDLSYTRVVDGLIRKGVSMIIVPTLDELHWGQSQHQLHARIAPMRSAEYGAPIVRVGACGISQAVDSEGIIRASTEFPGKEGMIHATMTLSDHAHVPLDRYLVWGACLLVSLDLLAMGFNRFKKRSAIPKPSARIE